MAITVEVTPEYLLLRTDLPEFNEAEATRFAMAIKEQQPEVRPPMVIFDLAKSTHVTIGALRLLTRGIGQMSESASRIAMIAQKEVIKFVADNGLDRLFPCHATLKEVIAPSAPAASSPREKTLEFLNTTLEAIRYVLEVSTQIPVKPGRGFLRGSAPDPKVDIAASVGIISTAFHGALILAFPARTYLKIMSAFLGVEYLQMAPEIRDGAAELLNIVLGQAKTSLNEKGYDIRRAVPIVSYGENLKIASASSVPSMIVPFSSDAGEFYVELMTNPFVRA